MRLLFAIVLGAACLLESSASTAVTVAEQILQQGQFAKAGCKPDAKDPDYNECICDADIRYPALSGMGDKAAQDKLNDWFRQQASAAQCEGDKLPAPGKDKAQDTQSHASQSVHYEQTFSSPELLAFKFTDWAYTGGAHGNGSVIGVIVDATSGKPLTPTDILSSANMAGVNDVIYKTLSVKPEEEIFRDQIEARQGVFIKDGECQGCTLTLMPDGIHVLFQTYEVAPYGAGNTDVAIPAKLLANPLVKQALAMEVKPEKK